MSAPGGAGPSADGAAVLGGTVVFKALAGAWSSIGAATVTLWSRDGRFVLTAVDPAVVDPRIKTAVPPPFMGPIGGSLTVDQQEASLFGRCRRWAIAGARRRGACEPGRRKLDHDKQCQDNHHKQKNAKDLRALRKRELPQARARLALSRDKLSPRPTTLCRTRTSIFCSTAWRRRRPPATRWARWRCG